jgi:hypothetical protein
VRTRNSRKLFAAELCIGGNQLEQYATDAEMIQQKNKLRLQQGFIPGLQRDRSAPKPCHEHLLIPRASFFHFTELATCCEQ